jgi:nitrate reductase gamma subunit
MNAFYSLFLVFALIVLVVLGVGAAGLNSFFAVVIPYAAVLIFLIGFVYRVVSWSRSAVPFRIPTTGGQQKSFDWIDDSPTDNPTTVRGTVIRMLLEVLLFRSLFRNTAVTIKRDDPENPVVGYNSSPWLWLFGLMFHYGFLIVLLRHLRFFLDPVPGAIVFLDGLDGIFQIGVPVLYLSDLILVGGATLLLLRRLVLPKMRYLSLAADFFPLFLILGIALSGIYMRYLERVDIPTIKEFTMSLVLFNPAIPEAGLPASFYVHLFLVSVLWAYFPFSKLMHLGGVFLSPTRNLPNNSRFKHHVNPWNPKVKWHTYEAYEDDFREPMIEAGLPVEKKEADA